MRIEHRSGRPDITVAGRELRKTLKRIEERIGMRHVVSLLGRVLIKSDWWRRSNQCPLGPTKRSSSREPCLTLAQKFSRVSGTRHKLSVFKVRERRGGPHS
jgi:hypothetical protein